MSYSGYTFDGWITGPSGAGTYYHTGDSFTPTGNVTLYAKWYSNGPTITTYTVTFDRSGASGSVPGAMQVQAGQSITLPGQGGMTYSGYTFDGWTTGPSGAGTYYHTGDSFTPTSNIILYAKWESAPVVTTYTVTFDANGGSGAPPNAQTVSAGQSITLPSPVGMSRSGYTFSGWNTDSSGAGTNYAAGSSFAPTGNVTLYAKWESSGPQLTAPTLSVEILSRGPDRTVYRFSWTPVEGAEGYMIYHGSSEQNVRTVARRRGLETSIMIVEGVVPNMSITTYYMVSAYNSSGEGPPSNIVSVISLP